MQFNLSSLQRFVHPIHNPLKVGWLCGHVRPMASEWWNKPPHIKEIMQEFFLMMKQLRFVYAWSKF